VFRFVGRTGDAGVAYRKAELLTPTDSILVGECKLIPFIDKVAASAVCLAPHLGMLMGDSWSPL